MDVTSGRSAGLAVWVNFSPQRKPARRCPPLPWSPRRGHPHHPSRPLPDTTAGPSPRVRSLPATPRGRCAGLPGEPQAGLCVAAMACRRGQPVLRSWAGRYHTDVHAGIRQATVKCPHAARTGCAAQAVAQWHRSHDTRTRPGPHSCPLAHRAG
jgi:hypothetical protein